MPDSNYMLADMYMSDDNKPIGWWLKEVDRLLEASFEQLLAADNLTRRQWQALNAAATHRRPPAAHAQSNTATQELGLPGPAAPGAGIAEALAPFLSGDPAEVVAVTGPLVARGWLVGEGLTADGERALEALSVKVRAQRRRVVAGISDEEYLATVDVLRRMAGNLT
ncbi:hypothetical protein [Kribbella sp. NPDC050459]|uniref:hypothetical protein n=1 Tax=Kribbella sp. NPDC050459 TaxID=3155785 RepID=UPI0033C6F7BF